MDPRTGLFVDTESGQVGVASAVYTVMIALRPDEMRAFADRLHQVADELDDRAEALVDSALAKARGTMN